MLNLLIHIVSSESLYIREQVGRGKMAVAGDPTKSTFASCSVQDVTEVEGGKVQRL